MGKFKKISTLVLALCLVMPIAASCSSSTAATTTAGKTADTTTAAAAADTTAPVAAGDLVVGLMTTSIAAPTFVAMDLAQRTAVEAAGGTVVEAAWDLTSDGTVTAVEELIQKGANSITIIPFDESILPKISRLCEEAKCYFSLSCRYIADEDIRAELEANPYFAGTCKEDEEKAGYDMIKALATVKGVKQIALISQPTGDQVTNGRDAGIQKACAEFGVELVAEVRNISAASDATKAVESFFASYPELGAVVYGGSSVSGCVASMLTGFENAGKTGKAYLVGWDFDDTMQAGFESGTVFCFAGGHLTVDPVIANSISMNAAMGTPLSESGPVYLDLPLMMVYSWADVEDYLNNVIYNENVPYNPEELNANFFQFTTSAVTAETLQSYISNWSLADIKTRHAA